MTDHPILFKGDMVKAILDGTKTQTRRTRGLDYINTDPPQPACNVRFHDGEWQCYGAGGVWVTLRCPYGVPGDRLWVRETFSWTGLPTHLSPSEFVKVADRRGKMIQHRWDKGFPHGGHYIWEYAADLPHPDWITKWKPSIHMPRRASRITLDVLDVRVERVQDMTIHDAVAEGVDQGCCSCDGDALVADTMMCPPHIHYGWVKLWDSINAKRGFGWDVNPWTWAVTFKRIDACEPTP